MNDFIVLRGPTAADWITQVITINSGVVTIRVCNLDALPRIPNGLQIEFAALRRI